MAASSCHRGPLFGKSGSSWRIPFFFFLRQKCVDPLVWWSGSEYLDQLSQLHVLTSVVTRKFLTRAFGTLLASVPCGMILDDMWARTHLLNSSTFTTAAVDSSRLSKRKDGKHCSNNHVCDSDHCHRTCYRSNNHIHATGKMYRTVSDVHDALGAELWSMGQRKFLFPLLKKLQYVYGTRDLKMIENRSLCPWAQVQWQSVILANG